MRFLEHPCENKGDDRAKREQDGGVDGGDMPHAPQHQVLFPEYHQQCDKSDTPKVFEFDEIEVFGDDKRDKKESRKQHPHSKKLLKGEVMPDNFSIIHKVKPIESIGDNKGDMRLDGWCIIHTTPHSNNVPRVHSILVILRATDAAFYFVTSK